MKKLILVDDTEDDTELLLRSLKNEGYDAVIAETDFTWCYDLFENANDLIQSVAPDGRILYVNKRWREVLGYGKDEVSDLTLWDIIHPDSMPHCRAAFQEVISGKTMSDVAAVFVAKDGSSIQVEGNVNCRFVDGEPVATRGVFRDVTERKVVEGALRKGAKRLRETKEYLDNIIESSADAIVVVDMDGIVRSWNRAAEEYMGYTADEVIGTPNSRFFVDPDEPERIMDLMTRDGMIKNYRTVVLNKDQKLVHVSMSAALLRDKDGTPGTPIGTVRVSRDITKLAELNAQVKEERDNLNRIFESMVDCVYIVSSEYITEFMNRVMIDEFGDHVGDTCYSVFHDRTEPCPLCELHEVLGTGGGGRGWEETVRREWHSRRTGRTYDLVETPVRNASGTTSKLTIFRDVTERKRTETELKRTALSLQEYVKQLEESRKKIEEACSLREHFLRETSHRIITPTAIIGGCSELLLDSGSLDDYQRQKILTIRERNMEIQKLVKEALEEKYLEDVAGTDVVGAGDTS